jgi:8-oxo-dGTP diphosphatase
MKSKRRKIKRNVTQAAGGIVTRRGSRPLIAVVQRRKDKTWVLPKGKLKRDENAMTAARREVVEETGSPVTVGRFLGAVSYRAGGKPKVVRFWQMRAARGEPRALMRDIRAVDWLPLKKAVARLSDPLERVFLREVGAETAKARRRVAASKRKKPARNR